MAASAPTLSLPNLVPPTLVTLPPPSSLPIPDTSATPPTQSQPSATSDPPISSNSTSPPPQLPPSSISAPPPVSLSPPPPQLPSSSPPVVSAPPPPLPPALPVPTPTPPPTLSPLSPPTDIPPTISPPNSSVPAPPPMPSPPPAVSPTPALASPPPPVNISPPAESPPPPSVDPPANSPPPPVQPPPVPAGSQAPPPGPNAPTRPLPPPRNPPSPLLSPLPANSSGGGILSTPPPPSPATPMTNTSSDSAPAPGNVVSPASGGNGASNAAVIGSVVGLVLLCAVGLGLWLFLKRKRKMARFHGGHVIPTQIDSSQMSDSPNSKTMSSAPLVENASGRSGFSYPLSDSGGFGSVYKGCLTDGREVAVKQLKVGGGQGEREFRVEVEIISHIHHRHLVSLVGYCISEHQRLLVYDYVPNDTLFYHLHGQGRPVLDWATRVKIAAGAARGLAYLYEDCHPWIIHRDIKSSNILLDNNFEAQVSDFGLAKLTLDSYTHVTTRVMGTFGYLAPEYASSGKLTDKSDVYSFGVVLLELITGHKPVDASQPLGDESLVEWARPLMSKALDNGDFEGLTDPSLGMNYVESEMFRMIEAAAACVRHSAAKRPRMAQVVRALEGFADSPDLNNGVRAGQSEMFDLAQQCTEIRMFQRMAFGNQDYSTSDFSRANWRVERDL